MSLIEPFDGWLQIYNPEEDELSPFFGEDVRPNDHMVKVYNQIMSPYWDEIGSITLYCKLLYVDYSDNCAIIELAGEWNDAVENDIMYLKRELIDVLLTQKVTKYILIAENVLNFHGSDDSYYQEWAEDIEDESGYVIILNSLQHVQNEMQNDGLSSFVFFFQYDKWRTHLPQHFAQHVEKTFFKGFLS